MDDIPDLDPKTWWRVFLRSIKSKSISYGIKKKGIERQLKRSISRKIDALEADEVIAAAKDERWRYLYQKLRDLELKEVESYRTRIRGPPRYEQGEPDVAFYAYLEKDRKQKSVISSLLDRDGFERSDKSSLIGVVKHFYADLFSPSKVYLSTQTKLLGNIKKKISLEHRAALDAPISKEELRLPVKSLNTDKSPRMNGLPAEFHQTYWHMLESKYLPYLLQVQKEGEFYIGERQTCLV